MVPIPQPNSENTTTSYNSTSKDARNGKNRRVVTRADVDSALSLDDSRYDHRTNTAESSSQVDRDRARPALKSRRDNHENRRRREDNADRKWTKQEGSRGRNRRTRDSSDYV